jgi:hypothetical protein
MELPNGHRFDVGSHLEDAVRRGVDDRLARGAGLLAEPLEDLGARGGDVAEAPPPDQSLEPIDDLEREAVGERRERAIEDHTSKLPVARDGVLARGDLGHGAEGAERHG